MNSLFRSLPCKEQTPAFTPCSSWSRVKLLERIWLAYSGLVTTSAPLPHTHTNTLWLNRLSLMRKKSFHKGEIGMLFLKWECYFWECSPNNISLLQTDPQIPTATKTEPTGLLENKDLFISKFQSLYVLTSFLVSWLFIWEGCCWQCHLIVGKWLQV